MEKKIQNDFRGRVQPIKGYNKYNEMDFLVFFFCNGKCSNRCTSNNTVHYIYIYDMPSAVFIDAAVDIFVWASLCLRVTEPFRAQLAHATLLAHGTNGLKCLPKHSVSSRTGNRAEINSDHNSI